MKKYYINVNDFQGGNWAMGCIGTIKYWQERAIEWCDNDENYELLKEIKKHKLDTELLGIISEIWSIDIVEFSVDNINTILETYSKEDLKWLLWGITDILYKGDKK